MLAGAVGAIAFAVASTRVLLGVHWVTDVVAGLIVGWSWFAISSVAFGGRRLRFAQPAHVAAQTAEALAGGDGAPT
jgi:membrane-associated phospholipid phosphatase